jgi:hypothetical protein
MSARLVAINLQFGQGEAADRDVAAGTDAVLFQMVAAGI